MAIATNFRHAGLVVSDLEGALHFYCEVLGFEIVKRADETGAYIENMLALKGVKATTVKMKLPDGVLPVALELLWFHPPHSKPRSNQLRVANDVGFTHIALTVNDLDATFKKLTAQGIAFNAPPQLSPDGYAKVTFCRDPEGNLLELVEVLKK